MGAYPLYSSIPLSLHILLTWEKHSLPDFSGFVKRK